MFVRSPPERNIDFLKTARHVDTLPVEHSRENFSKPCHGDFTRFEVIQPQTDGPASGGIWRS